MVRNCRWGVEVASQFNILADLGILRLQALLLWLTGAGKSHVISDDKGGNGDVAVSTAAKPSVLPSQVRVLLVGDKEEDFFLVREILERTRGGLAAELDHAHSLDEAKLMLQQKPYGLVLFEHETGDAEAVRLLAEFLHNGFSIPFIVLTEDADERTVAEIIEEGTWNCLTKSQLDGATLVRTIRSALALHSMHKEQQAAEDSLRKLSQAVEQSADIIMVANCDGVVEYANPAFEALTGYSRGEVCGKTLSMLLSDEQGPELYQEMWKTVRGGNVFRGILVNRRKNGELYYVEENISPVRDSKGKITHFVANGRDLTERVRLEGQLLQAQKMDAIGRLAGGVAHDFNNLLTIITSYAELALDSTHEGSALSAKIQEILLAARRAAELTRQLLAFSRKQPRALRVADLNQVITDIAKTLPRLIGEDIEFSFVPGHGLGRVRVDPVQIEQILMNLASNARDAMPQGGHLRIETGNVTIDEPYLQNKKAAIPLGRYTLITVSDDGVGIRPADLPHIFEPFFTTKPATQGTGLGLATVYGIVKQNKGFIWAYSEPGMGTVFKIYLPCTSVQSAVGEAENVKPESAARGSETILLVEDEQAVRRATAEFLTLQGYTVLEAKDGVDAVSVVKGYNPPIHLAITDVVMPNMSGGQLAKELAHLRPETRLLFVSGYAGKTVLDHQVFHLETNFLQKPYSLKQLSGKIRQALQYSENRPAARALS
jgi:two-component system, cell cycle sensor histidine kinase and response regulator CckA